MKSLFIFARISNMNWQSFISMIQNPNTATVCFPSAKNDHDIGCTISALTNTNGGNIVLGFDRVNIHLTGYDLADTWIDQFLDNYFSNSEISVIIG